VPFTSARRETFGQQDKEESQLVFQLLQTTTNMPAAVRNTVDRLDKPSAYYTSRVSDSILVVLHNYGLS
jgi:hypothetical protein